MCRLPRPIVSPLAVGACPGRSFQSLFAIIANAVSESNGQTSGFSPCCHSCMPQPKPPTSVFGKRLRAARLALGWTQAELGRRIGMEEQNTGAPRVSRYETGQHDPDPATAEALAKVLGLPVAYFYATPDVLADIILLVSQLPAAKQKEALERLREFVGKSEMSQRDR